ncbi:MAG: ABC transporter ATP-binding protein [Actinomycetota bacterium]
MAVEVATDPRGPAPPEDVIRTEGLTKVFHGRGGTVRAVDGLDLGVRPGEIFGLLGPNGAGKTTTVGMLTTRVVPTAGAAWIAGIDVARRPAATKRVIGVVPQTNTLDRSLDVGENLYFHGRYFGMSPREARAAADELLDRFRLADRARAEVDQLSGGMAQRLMVARAIMHRPRILFLDEPTAGLDPQSRIALWDVVRELHADGQTILLTTHYMEEADQLCDRVAIMDRGRLLALDTPARLKATVGVDTEVRLHVAGDRRALVTLLETMPDVDGGRVVDDTVYVYVRHGGPTLPEILTIADRAGYGVFDVGVTAPTLETVFISLTGKDLRE